MKISFCTTCSNRVHQLRQVFAANAAGIAVNADTEWLIVDFGSKDDLDGFMRDQLSSCGDRIVYVSERSKRPWHASIAKNVAHRAASGDVLVNLDCDNFIGESIDEIRRRFTEGVDVLHMWSGALGDGTCGRIAIRSTLFHTLGGYDETFHPMGYQDFDLVRRASAHGACVLRSPCVPGLSIKNTKAESVRHCAQSGLTWDDFNRLNRAQSMANVAAGRLVANTPQGWAPLQVEVTRGTTAAASAVPRPSAPLATPPSSNPTSPSNPPSPSKSPTVLRRLLGFFQAPRAARVNQKKTIVFAWELGRGMGHIQRLLPIATHLSLRGHQVGFVFRSQTDAADVAKVLPSAPILPAPVFRRAKPIQESPAFNYADILYRTGYESFESLAPLILQWRELFESIEPHLIVCDHSPTVILAAAGRIPVVHVGSGFANPPAEQRFLPLYPGSRKGADLREAQVLKALRGVTEKLGVPAIDGVSDVFAHATTFACSLPELDPYRSVRTVPAIGPLSRLPSPGRNETHDFVFGYLSSEDARVLPLLESLARANVRCSMFIRQTPPEWEAKFEGTSVRLFDRPQKMPDVLAAATAVIHHGGLSTTEMALAVGRPQFLLPRYLEQALTADAVEALGCGVNLVRKNTDPGRIIAQALSRRTFAAEASAVAQRLGERPQTNVLQTVLDACVHQLASARSIPVNLTA